MYRSFLPVVAVALLGGCAGDSVEPPATTQSGDPDSALSAQVQTVTLSVPGMT